MRGPWCHCERAGSQIPLQYTAVTGPGSSDSAAVHTKSTLELVGNLCPDTVAVDAVRKHICILEYFRPSATRPEALHEAACRKTEKYQVLLAALHHYTEGGWTVTLFPLPVGVQGSLLFEHWVPALETLKIPKTKFRGVLHQAAMALLKAVHTLHL